MTASSRSPSADIGVELDVQRAAARRDAVPTIGDAARSMPSASRLLTEDAGLLAFDRGRAQPCRSRTRGSSAARLRSARRARRASSIAPRRARGSRSPVPADRRLLSRCRYRRQGSSPADAGSALLHLAGLLLREALGGLKGLALAQRELRDQSQHQIGRRIRNASDLTGLPVEESAAAAAVGHNSSELDAVQWLRDTLGSTREHDLAFMRALHSALVEFVARLDPRALAQSMPPSGADAGNADASGLTRALSQHHRDARAASCRICLPKPSRAPSRPSSRSRKTVERAPSP